MLGFVSPANETAVLTCVHSVISVSLAFAVRTHGKTGCKHRSGAARIVVLDRGFGDGVANAAVTECTQSCTERHIGVSRLCPRLGAALWRETRRHCQPPIPGFHETARQAPCHWLLSCLSLPWPVEQAGGFALNQPKDMTQRAAARIVGRPCPQGPFPS